MAMHSKDVVIAALNRNQSVLAMTLADMTPEQMAFRPDETSNSLAWLAWHLTRVQDREASGLSGQEQAWIAEGWHAKFGKAADPNETGMGYTPDQVAASETSTQLILDYHNAVVEHSKAYLEPLTHDDLAKELDEPQWDPVPTVGVRLVSILSDNTQHIGQMAYVRGIIEGRKWYPS